MLYQRVATSLLQLFVILLGVGHYLAQDNSITFLPDARRCIGEEVEMICYISSGSLVFITSVALISLNGSASVIPATFNGQPSLGGVDTTRYTADIAGLTISTSRPGVRVTISDYQATDGSVLFGCAGLLSGGTTSGVLVSDSPQSLASPPSPPVSLTADYNSPTCSGSVQLAWTPGASDRDIEMYFLSLNGVLIASLGPVTSYNDTTTLQRDMEYTYSVVAMSCAGNSTETNATSISVGNPPSSPVVTLSQTDTSCSNLLVSWSTPSSNKSILTYSVNRNDTFLTDTTDNQYTDNTQLSISTVYEYSVVANSCAGTSAAGVKSVMLGFSLTNNPSIFLSYDNTSRILTIDWTFLPFSPSQPISINYTLVLNYTHSQYDNMTNFSDNSTFQQLSTDTNHTVPLSPHPFTTDDGVVTNITVCLQITQQCGLAFSGVNMCASFNSENPPTTIPPTTPTVSAASTASTITPTAPLVILPIIIGSVAGVGAILLISIILIFIIVVYVCCIRSRKNTADTSDKKSIHMYEDINETHAAEYVDMSRMDGTAVTQPTESQQYIQMSALHKNQLPPNYENVAQSMFLITDRASTYTEITPAVPKPPPI